MKQFLLRVMWGLLTIPLTALSILFIWIIWHMDTAPEWSRDYDALESVLISVIGAISFVITAITWVKFLGHSPIELLERFDEWLNPTVNQ